MKPALRWYLPLVVVAATINLRPALLTLGIVLPAVQKSLALSPLESGLLTALPILALGFSSAIAVPFARRLGYTGGLLVALLLTGAGIVMRSGGTTLLLFSGAIVLGIGIGLGNVYAPTLVKARLAAHIGIAMGVYTMMLALGALLASAVTPALFTHFADWKAALAVWAFPVAVAFVLTIPLLVDNAKPQEHVAGMGLWRNGIAWAVSGYMGLQSGMFYGAGLWLAPLLIARGMPLGHIATDLTLFYFTQFLAALVSAPLLTRVRWQGTMAAVLAASVGVLLAGILYAPFFAVAFLCALLGVSMGAMFACALTFQVIRAHTTDNAARLASMAQCVGYLIASIGPLVLGLVNRAEHARLESTIWFVLLSCATATCGMIAGRPRFVDPDARSSNAALQGA